MTQQTTADSFLDLMKIINEIDYHSDNLSDRISILEKNVMEMQDRDNGLSVMITTLEKQLDECRGEIGKLNLNKADGHLVAHHYIEVNKKLDGFSDLSIKVDRQWDLNYKADENLSKRISGLEQRIKDIEYRLEHITRFPSEVDIRLEEVERIIDKIPDNYARKDRELEIRIENLETIKYVQKVQYFDVRKPHMCPVCNGTSFCKEGMDCKACDGTCIVWD